MDDQNIERVAKVPKRQEIDVALTDYALKEVYHGVLLIETFIRAQEEGNPKA